MRQRSRLSSYLTEHFVALWDCSALPLLHPAALNLLDTSHDAQERAGTSWLSLLVQSSMFCPDWEHVTWLHEMMRQLLLVQVVISYNM
jgi:hypothetical protein